MLALVTALAEERSALVEEKTQQIEYVMELEERILELEAQMEVPVRAYRFTFCQYLTWRLSTRAPRQRTSG